MEGSEYRIGSRDYLDRARAQLSSDTEQGLTYAALELRCGIEARLQEYLEPHNHVALGRKTEWRVGKLHNSAQAAFQLGDTVARIRIIEEANGRLILTVFYTPVTTRLKDIAERIGEFLHVPKRFSPSDDAMWAQMRTIVREGIELLETATYGTLLGPMLRNPASSETSLPMELVPEHPEVAKTIQELRDKKLIVQVRYFPDLASALDDA